MRIVRGTLKAMLFPLLINLMALPAGAEADAKSPAQKRWGWFGVGREWATYLEQGPMIGHATSSSLRIWAQSSGPARLDVLVSQEPDLRDGRKVHGPRLTEEHAFMGAVEVDGLEPNTRYFYCLLLDGRRAMLPPYHSVHTAIPEGEPGHVRFAFISCLGYHGYDSAASWGDLTRTNIDLLLMLGDNHYANTTDETVQRSFYRDQRNAAGFRDVTHHTPTYGIWDDHDFGPDNSDGTLEGKERSLQTFQEHWANPAYGEADNPGVYSKFTRGPVEFFLLDSRYHRTPNRLRDAPGRTLLGARQLAWLKRALIDSTATLKVIACGSEWQSNGTDDGWNGFRAERDEIFRFIEDNNIQGVLLISGDRHFTAAYQVAGKLIEVTSGPFGSGNATTKPLPEMFLYQGEGKLYCIYDIDTTGETPAVTLEVYRAGNGQVARRSFTWDEVLGRTQIKPLK